MEYQEPVTFISSHENTRFSFGLMKTWPDLDQLFGSIFSPTPDDLPSTTAATLGVWGTVKRHHQELRSWDNDLPLFLSEHCCSALGLWRTDVLSAVKVGSSFSLCRL